MLYLIVAKSAMVADDEYVQILEKELDIFRLWSLQLMMHWAKDKKRIVFKVKE